jgi:hypothetical protein
MNDEGSIFIIEDTKPKLHLTHLEDLVIEEGKEGFKKFEQQVNNLINYLNGLETETTINLKVDGCFSPDTKLVTQFGVLSIEDIINRINNKVEVMVLTYNFQTQKNEYVLASEPSINKNGKKTWVKLTLINDDVVYCTGDHLIYTNNRGYVKAEDLTTEDDIKEYFGEQK